MKKGISKFDDLVTCFEKLPGVGKKSALKYAYHVSLVDSFSGLNLAHSIEDAVSFLKRCQKCGALSEDEICDICADSDRDRALMCIVESPKDLLILEQSKVYNGLYFILDNIDNLIVEKLRTIIKENDTKELIFALTPGINSDSVMIYIEDKLQDLDLHFSKIAQGIPTGVSLDNVDMLSLMKAMSGRMDT